MKRRKREAITVTKARTKDYNRRGERINGVAEARPCHRMLKRDH